MSLYALGENRPLLPGDGTGFVAPGARLVGRVVLGRHVGIWFGAVLRADSEPITIGDESNIQDNAVGHVDPGFPLIVGRGCTIGHGAIIHGCTIGDGTLVGMGAAVLNGAVIGEECLIGAKALVTEGKVFPPRSLIVGVPARVLRTLDASALDGLKRSAATYVARARLYRERFRDVGLDSDEGSQ